MFKCLEFNEIKYRILMAENGVTSLMKHLAMNKTRQGIIIKLIIWQIFWVRVSIPGKVILIMD